MTLIECFTGAHIDNIAACLRLRPEKMVLLGDAAEMAEAARRYEKLLQQRRQETRIKLWDTGGMDLRQLRESLDILIRQEEDCVIDLTGGDEMVIMAFGAVLVQLEERLRQKIRVEKYDRETGRVQSCIGDRCAISSHPEQLTVEELIALHGGCLHREGYQPPQSSTARDIRGLWRVVSDEPKTWNKSIQMLNEFESRADSRQQVYLPLNYLRGGIPNFDRKETAVRELLDKLQRRGVIRDESSRNALEYTYESPLLSYCTAKAGNVLEVKTLLEGRSVTENGRPFFGDSRMSVIIDWDGVVHDPAQRIPETRNEVDVVLMHGLTPLFISCKNGAIGEDELYKLHTVAGRFGGPYAKKMLIATDMDQGNMSSNRAFIQRAWDMDIFLVTDAAELADAEWEAVFKQAVQ